MKNKKLNEFAVFFLYDLIDNIANEKTIPMMLE